MSKRIYLLLWAMGLFISHSLFAVNHPHFEDFTEEGEILEGQELTFKSQKKLPLKVSITTRNFSQNDLVKLNKAIKILETVMNSDHLKNLILTFEHKGQVQFFQNNGLTNFEILSLIMTGKEELNPIEDYTMNFDLTMYKSFNPWSKTKGYTKPDTLRIWINSRYYRKKSWTAADVAGNLAHEWLHKIGFTHEYYDSEDRPSSVPYAIGYLVRDIAKNVK